MFWFNLSIWLWAVVDDVNWTTRRKSRKGHQGINGNDAHHKPDGPHKFASTPTDAINLDLITGFNDRTRPNEKRSANELEFPIMFDGKK